MEKTEFLVFREHAVQYFGIRFNRGSGLHQKIRQVAGMRWNPGRRCWYHAAQNFPLDRVEARLERELPELRDKILAIQNAPYAQVLAAFAGYMKTKRYSPASTENYCSVLRVLIQKTGKEDVIQLSAAEFKDFQRTHIIEQHLSESYQNIFINAVRLYYRWKGIAEPPLEIVERPRRSKPLPRVMTLEEVGRAIRLIQNVKHKTMISVIYGCGLRAGDLLALKPGDIQSSRHVIHVQRGKGRKDRLVPISDKLIALLRAYYKTYRPAHFLFEGQVAGTPYSERSLQQVWIDAQERAGFSRRYRLHDLRHSYATHQIEAGVNVRYIQEILGHSSIKTTQIYTHVTSHELSKIKSPFDDLDL